MTKPRRTGWFAVLLFFAAFISLSPARAEDGISVADEAYNKGDCAKAIPIYQKFSKENPEALYKLSYCQLNTGNAEEARKGFQGFLKKNPTDLEARVRYSQALIQSKKYSPALKVLNGIQSPGDWKAEIEYWKGMAHHSENDISDAREAFQSCYDSSANEAWTRKTCQEWLTAIDTRKRAPFWTLRSGLGLMYDGNVTQSTNQFISMGGGGGGGGPGGGGQGGPRGPSGRQPTVIEDSSSMVSDQGYVARAGLNLNLLRDSAFTLSTSFDASLNQYFSQKDYSTEFMTLVLRSGYTVNDTWQINLAATVSDMRYNFSRYQDSVTVTPSVGLATTNTSYLNFSVDTLKTYYGTDSMIVTGRSNYSWYPEGHYFQIGISAARSLADQAVISGEPPSVTSGALFSNYWMTEASLFYSKELFWKIYVGPSMSLIYAKYDEENLPDTQAGGGPPSVLRQAGPPGGGGPGGGGGSGGSGGGPSGGGGGGTSGGGTGGGQSARTDLMLIPGLSISRVLFVDSLQLSVSLRYTKNISSGFQGLPDSSTGSISTQSYARPLVTTELGWVF